MCNKSMRIQLRLYFYHKVYYLFIRIRSDILTINLCVLSTYSTRECINNNQPNVVMSL